MKNTLQIGTNEKFNASLLFFIICAAQVGVGVHGFQAVIYQNAKHDAWISILISFLAVNLLMIVTFKLLEMYESNDIFGINLDIFGKYIGNFINLLLVLYCGAAFFAIIRNYTDVINAWVFPELKPSFIVITLLILVIYAFTAGLRIIIGICFFSFFLGLWIPIALLLPVDYANVNYLLPVFNNDLIDILKGAYYMSFTIVGFEVIHVLYPFVKEKKKAKKYVHLGLLFTMVLYLFVMIITLTFFSGEQLEKTIWATLSLFSIIRLPFLERIELITICFWMIVILPNLCLYAWSAYRGFMRIAPIKETKFILIFSLLIFIASFFVETRTQIHAFNYTFGTIAFYIVLVYPIFMYFIALIKKSALKHRARRE